MIPFVQWSEASIGSQGQGLGTRGQWPAIRSITAFFPQFRA
jgi:hypothetical protein